MFNCLLEKGGDKVEIKKEKYDYYYAYAYFPKGILLTKPIVTVCYILTKDNNVGRGISICSPKDIPDSKEDSKEGKRLAKYNAIRVLKGRSIPLIRRKEAIEQLIRVKCPFIKKGELNPHLSWWERKFLFGRKRMYEYKYKGGYRYRFELVEGQSSLYNCRCLSNPIGICVEKK